MKIGHCEVAKRSRGWPNKKNLGSVGLLPDPILAKMGRSRPIFPERCHPLTCPSIPNLVRIGCILLDLLPAIRSLERRGRYLFYCMFVCSSTISRQRVGRFTPKFACWRTLVPDVSSPLLGVGGPRRAEKRANEIFVTMGVNGEFLHFGGF